MTKLICLIFATCIAVSGFAQTVTESEAYIAGGKQNALVGRIPKGDIELIAKEWKNLMKKYKADVSGKEEIFGDNAVIKSISDNPMDVYARVERGRDDEVKITIAFDLGGYFMSSAQQPALFKSAQKFIEKFVEDQSKSAYKSNLKSEEKVLSTLEKDKKKLEKENEKIAKKNEDLRQQIQENQQKIKNNQTTIENTGKMIMDQEAKIKGLKNEKPK
ncbi:MAG: hypothetical protein KA793_00195 [Bacteroidales bacterium]|nr:hypothetical protein [Bacteroidales bacterium]